MKKVIFIVGPALGHVGRSLVIARALDLSSSCEIGFIGIDSGKKQLLTLEPFPVHRIKAQPENSLKFADDLEALLGQLSPDLICLDMTPIPWLTFVRFPQVPMLYITQFFLTQAFSYDTIQERQFALANKEINEVRVSRGLMPILGIKTLYERDAVLLCDPLALIARHKALPANYHVVGPCTWEPDIDLPEELLEKKNLLFVSFGSTGYKKLSRQDTENIAHAIGVKTIVWLGVNQASNMHNGGLIQHLVYPQLPASKVIARSRLVITHGGAGSSYQALAQAVPLGVWPSHQNQYLLGSLIQKAGCGVLLEDALAGSVDIAKGLNRMRAHGRKLAGSLGNVNGPRKAAEVILRMLR